jgi:hypothetical protein
MATILSRISLSETLKCESKIKIKGVSMEMMSDRKEWKKKTCCAGPPSGIRG